MSTALTSARQTGTGLTISVWLLGFTQIVGYGALYYGFAILAEDIARSLQWPVSWVFAGFSLSLLAGALIAPVVGRRIDRHGAAKVMAVGSVGAAGALLLTAWAPNPLVFVTGLIAMQLASTLVLYDAAFAHLVEVAGPVSPRLITYVTLIAGFSSTIFWPVTTGLSGMFTWREILAIFAAINIAFCFPVHLWLARAGTGSVRDLPAQPGVDPARLDATPLPDHLQPRALSLVTWGFALSGFLLMAILAQMVPLLSAMGIGSASVMVAALFGPAQVMIRFANMVVGSERYPMPVTILVAVLLPLAALLLAFAAPWTIGAVAFALMLGFASGLKSIVQGTLPLALFGRTGYATRLGKMAAVRLVLAALAPFFLAYLLEAFGPSVALSVLALIGLAGLAAFIEVARMNNQDRKSGIERIATGAVDPD
jgi:MFS family permease